MSRCVVCERGNPRNLKIEEFNPGAKFRAKPAATVRLKGQWLHAAGFPPGGSVRVTVVSPGVIELRLKDAPTTNEMNERN
jgi:hypothetical protein